MNSTLRAGVFVECVKSAADDLGLPVGEHYRVNLPVTGVAGQTIHPYTDLLLHDMGQALADNFADGAANGREWRTPPLWGIGLAETVTGYRFFLHDGRARGLLEAVLWHGGEAATATAAVHAMDTAERAALIRFLTSL